jgi:hypothetical protein
MEQVKKGFLSSDVNKIIVATLITIFFLSPFLIVSWVVFFQPDKDPRDITLCCVEKPFWESWFSNEEDEMSTAYTSSEGHFSFLYPENLLLSLGDQDEYIYDYDEDGTVDTITNYTINLCEDENGQDDRCDPSKLSIYISFGTPFIEGKGGGCPEGLDTVGKTAGSKIWCLTEESAVSEYLTHPDKLSEVRFYAEVGEDSEYSLDDALKVLEGLKFDSESNRDGLILRYSPEGKLFFEHPAGLTLIKETRNLDYAENGTYTIFVLCEKSSVDALSGEDPECEEDGFSASLLVANPFIDGKGGGCPDSDEEDLFHGDVTLGKGRIFCVTDEWLSSEYLVNTDESAEIHFAASIEGTSAYTINDALRILGSIEF